MGKERKLMDVPWEGLGVEEGRCLLIDRHLHLSRHLMDCIRAGVISNEKHATPIASVPATSRGQRRIVNCVAVVVMTS